jgi:hypothetical protein
MEFQDRQDEDKSNSRVGAGVFSVLMGTLAMVVVCCGGQALALGALGGLAFGSAFGVGAGALAALLLVAGIIVIRRRRAEPCAMRGNATVLMSRELAGNAAVRVHIGGIPCEPVRGPSQLFQSVA